jgi:DNA-binding GntR family transcriptional regulator
VGARDRAGDPLCELTVCGRLTQGATPTSVGLVARTSVTPDQPHARPPLPIALGSFASTTQIPRHVEISRILEARIARNAYETAFLPSERSLCLEFGACRATVRQALGSLVAAGVIRRGPGKATAIVRRPSGPPAAIGFLEDMLLLAEGTGIAETRVRRDWLPEHVRDYFPLDRSAPTAAIDRLRTLKDEPFYWVVTVTNATDLLPQDSVDVPFIELLDCHWPQPIVMTRQVLSAIAANTEISTKLSVPEGAAILHMGFTYLTEQGVPAAYSSLCFNAKMYSHRINLGRSGRPTFVEPVVDSLVAPIVDSADSSRR